MKQINSLDVFSERLNTHAHTSKHTHTHINEHTHTRKHVFYYSFFMPFESLFAFGMLTSTLCIKLFSMAMYIFVDILQKVELHR